MERTETDVIQREFAEVAIEVLKTDPSALPSLEAATRRLMEHHGYHPAYRAIIAACQAGLPAVVVLLSSDTAEGDLVRSMVPLRAVISGEQRKQIIAAHKSRRKGPEFR